MPLVKFKNNRGRKGVGLAGETVEVSEELAAELVLKEQADLVEVAIEVVDEVEDAVDESSDSDEVEIVTGEDEPEASEESDEEIVS